MDHRDETTADGNRRMNTADNTGGDSSMTIQKKRSRRVSFAEMTSVHFFDRDEEDSETPSAKSAKIDGALVNDEVDDNDEDMEMPRSFLLPMGSPSPGGSTNGSASINDEDNFFGPVSAGFIRPERLSDSTASKSDDNHDITMDSTAFSMHYRSLARSESGGDLKTPTVDQLFSEEKTPRNDDLGSSMVFTFGKRHFPISSTPVSKTIFSHNSSDMSLVVENLREYDYGKLSPGLDKLLADSKKDLLSNGALNDVSTVKSPRSMENDFSSLDNGKSLVKFYDYFLKEKIRNHSHDLLNGNYFDAVSKVDGENSLVGTSHDFHSPKAMSSYAFDAATHNLFDSKLDESALKLNKNEYQSPLVASTSPVKQVLPITTSPLKNLQVSHSLPENLRSASVGHQAIESSIHRSISKLELLEKSTFSSAFSSKIDQSTIKSLEFSKTPPFKNSFYKERNSFDGDLFNDSIIQEQSIGSKSGRVGNNTISEFHQPETLKLTHENHSEESFSDMMIRKSPNVVGARNAMLTYGEPSFSPSKIFWSDNKLLQNFSTAAQSTEDALMTKTENLLAEIASVEGGKTIVTPLNLVSSLGKMVEEKDSTNIQSSQSISSIPQGRSDAFIDFEKHQDVAPLERNTVDANMLTEIRANMSIELKRELNSPIKKIYQLKNLVEAKATDCQEVDAQNKEIVGTINISSPAMDKNSQVMLSKTLDRGILKNTINSIVEDNLSQEEYQNISPMLGMELSHENLDKLNLPKRDFKNQGGSVSDLTTPESSNNVNNETSMTIKERITDILSKFSEDTKFCFLQSDLKFDAKMFDLLEDMLARQQRLRVYERLHADVMHKRTGIHHNLENVSEIDRLLTQIVFEKAKLQLKYLKRERLMKRLKLLSSRIQESQSISKEFSSLSMEESTSDARRHTVGDQSISIKSRKGTEAEIYSERTTAMRQTLEALERKSFYLSRKLLESCKIKAEPKSCNIVTVVNEHLMKRAQCGFILYDMQIWAVQSIDHINSHHKIVLSYSGFVVQSIKVVSGPTSSAIFSYEVNDLNIIQKFPNMDACIAFAFLFNTETKCKYVGSKTLVRETQTASSLFGTLMDLLEEVQMAQIEFQNLTQSSFSLLSVEQLVLKLCFYSLSSGRKVNLSLDMSYLKRGIYPSEVLPFQLQSPSELKRHRMPEPILSEIKNAIQSVKTGYMRVYRLCKCVSQVVKAASIA